MRRCNISTASIISSRVKRRAATASLNAIRNMTTPQRTADVHSSLKSECNSETRLSKQKCISKRKQQFSHSQSSVDKSKNFSKVLSPATSCHISKELFSADEGQQMKEDAGDQTMPSNSNVSSMSNAMLNARPNLSLKAKYSFAQSKHSCKSVSFACAKKFAHSNRVGHSNATGAGFSKNSAVEIGPNLSPTSSNQHLDHAYCETKQCVQLQATSNYDDNSTEDGTENHCLPEKSGENQITVQQTSPTSVGDASNKSLTSFVFAERRRLRGHVTEGDLWEGFPVDVRFPRLPAKVKVQGQDSLAEKNNRSPNSYSAGSGCIQCESEGGLHETQLDNNDNQRDEVALLSDDMTLQHNHDLCPVSQGQGRNAEDAESDLTKFNVENSTLATAAASGRRVTDNTVAKNAQMDTQQISNEVNLSPSTRPTHQTDHGKCINITTRHRSGSPCTHTDDGSSVADSMDKKCDEGNKVSVMTTSSSVVTSHAVSKPRLDDEDEQEDGDKGGRFPVDSANSNTTIEEPMTMSTGKYNLSVEYHGKVECHSNATANNRVKSVKPSTAKVNVKVKVKVKTTGHKLKKSTQKMAATTNSFSNSDVNKNKKSRVSTSVACQSSNVTVAGEAGFLRRPKRACTSSSVAMTTRDVDWSNAAVGDAASSTSRVFLDEQQQQLRQAQFHVLPAGRSTCTVTSSTMKIVCSPRVCVSECARRSPISLLAAASAAYNSSKQAVSLSAALALPTNRKEKFGSTDNIMTSAMTSSSANRRQLVAQEALEGSSSSCSEVQYGDEHLHHLDHASLSFSSQLTSSACSFPPPPLLPKRKPPRVSFKTPTSTLAATEPISFPQKSQHRSEKTLAGVQKHLHHHHEGVGGGGGGRFSYEVDPTWRTHERASVTSRGSATSTTPLTMITRRRTSLTRGDTLNGIGDKNEDYYDYDRLGMPLKRRTTQSVTRTAVTLAEKESLDIYAYILWSSDNTKERKIYENDHPTEPCDAVDAHFRNIWANEISSLKKKDYYVRAKAALENGGVSSPSRALNTQLGIVRDAKPTYSSFVTVNNSVNLVSSSLTNDSKPTLCRNQDTPDITCGQKVPNKQEEDQDMLRHKLIDLQRQLSRSDYDAFLQEYLRDFEAARNQLCANSGAGLDSTNKGNSSNGQELDPLGFMDAKDEGCGGSGGVATSTSLSSMITSASLSASCRSRLETAGRQMLLEKIGAWQRRVAQQRLLQKEIKERQEVQRRYKDLVFAHLASKNTNTSSASIDINFTALDILRRALSCLDNGEAADAGDKLPALPHLQQSGGGESKDNSNVSSSRLGQLLADLVDIETDGEATTASVLWPTRIIDERLIDIETYLLAPSLSGFVRLSLSGEEHVVPLVDNTILQDQLLCEASVLDALPVIGQDDLDACLGAACNDDSMFPKETESTCESASAAAAATAPLFFDQELLWHSSQQLPVATAHWYQTASPHTQLPLQPQFQPLEPPVWHRQPMQVSLQAELLSWQQQHQQLQHCQSPHQYQYEYAASQQFVWDHGQGQDCAHLHQRQLYDQQPQHQWLHRQRLPSISLPATGVTGDRRLSPPHLPSASHLISVMARPRRQQARNNLCTMSFTPHDELYDA